MKKNCASLTKNPSTNNKYIGDDIQSWQRLAAGILVLLLLLQLTPIEELEPFHKRFNPPKTGVDSTRRMSRLVIRIPVMNLNTKCSLQIIQS